MKGLKKIIFVVAIGSVSTAAFAELKPLGDSVMGAVTGQAGITIELETQIDIGEVVYTDEGSLAFVNTHVGGKGGTLIDDVAITVDVASDGDAVIDIHSLSGGPIDVAITQDSIELRGVGGENTVLASNLSLEGVVDRVNLTVDTATDTLNVISDVAIEDLDVDLDFLSVGLKNVTFHGAGYQDGVTTTGDSEYYVHSEASIGAGTSSGFRASGETSALEMNIAPVAMDIGIGAFEIGGTSIGSVNIDNLVLSNTNILVYGH